MPPARAPGSGLRFRGGRLDDVDACVRVFMSGRPAHPWAPNRLAPTGPQPMLERLLTHLIRTDPDLFFVALAYDADIPGRSDDEDRVVAFGAAHRRGDLWYLSFLYVEPAFQGQGVGHSLLRRLLAEGGASDEGLWSTGPADDAPRRAAPAVLATCTDAVQPVSNALYIRYGMSPRVPVFNLTGLPTEGGRAEPLPDGIRPEVHEDQPDQRLLGELAALDRVILGYTRDDDHRFLAETARTCVVYRGPSGAVVAYGYTSRAGRMGPVLVIDEALMDAVLGHLLAVVPPRGAFTTWVPGTAQRALQELLRLGLEIDGSPSLLCSSRAWSDPGRYLPLSLALY